MYLGVLTDFAAVGGLDEFRHKRLRLLGLMLRFLFRIITLLPYLCLEQIYNTVKKELLPAPLVGRL